MADKPDMQVFVVRYIGSKWYELYASAEVAKCRCAALNKRWCKTAVPLYEVYAMPLYTEIPFSDHAMDFAMRQSSDFKESATQ